MTAERWAQIKEIFGVAQEKPESERAGYLDEACGTDDQLRAEVERLLAQDDESLASPAADLLEQEAQELAAGDQLSHYRVEAKLGEGGMGAVYRAHDTRLHRPVALKVLPPGHFADTESKHRLLREARVASALNHTNIVAIYEAASDNGVDFIAMEFIPGTTLAAKIKAAPLRVVEILKLAVQIADALAAAHAAGIIHRDLKPSNVMVTNDGLVKVLDFGLAKSTHPASPQCESSLTEAKTAPGTVLGTPGYMSPEQVRGEAVDRRTDIFNFGLMLHEMLAGKPTFSGHSAMDAMSAILKDAAPDLPESVPGALRELVSNCLEKDPGRRFESARDLAFALRGMAAGSVVGGGVAKIEAAPGKRQWLLPTLTGLAVVALAFITLVRLPDDHLVDLGNYKLRPFATELAINEEPAWSPDGGSVVFVGTVNGLRQLFVQRLDSPTPFQITRHPLGGAIGSRYLVRPFWSPNSREIYFSGESGLERVSIAGGEPTPVQPAAIVSSISPDGRALAFLRPVENPPSIGVWMASPPEAAPKPYEPASIQGVTYANRPNIQFAPDGRKILLAVNLHGRGEQVWLLPWPARRPRRIFPDLPPLQGTPQFSWLRDSRHVLFSVQTDPSLPVRLFMGDVETGRFWPVLSESRSAVWPAVAPDGERAVYVSVLSHHDVIEAPLDGSQVRTLVGSYRNESMAAFSAPGRTIVYVTDRRGRFEVWVESLAEHWARPLLTPSDFHLPSGPIYWFMNPAPSPDGQRVAVVATNAAGPRLWMAGMAGSAPVRITAEDSEFAPTWSPDGQWLAVHRWATGYRTLAVVKIGTSRQPVDLVRWPSFESLPEWSPTGEWIACTLVGKPGITLVSPEGKSTRFLPGVSAPHAWSHNGRTIYQVRGTGDCSVVAVDIATGRERIVRREGDPCPSAPLSPGASC